MPDRLTQPKAVLEERFERVIAMGTRFRSAVAKDRASTQAARNALVTLDQWDKSTQALLDSAFTGPGPKAAYPANLDERLVGGKFNIYDARDEILQAFDHRLMALRSIVNILDIYDEPSETASAVQENPASPSSTPVAAVVAAPDVPPSADKAPSADSAIFVVHGHDRAALHETVRVLERGTGREIIVLREQANAGRTILEKFEDYAGHVSFAVVLLTGDDEGGVRSGDDTQLRGRQNVIFELGFFFGKLGRERVAVLLESNVEKPSDIDGLVYITLDESGVWKYALARDLEAAGILVNHSRIP